MNLQLFERKWSFPIPHTSRHLIGGTEEAHENPQSGQMIPKPRFEAIAS
jgi:hypothetical protein